MVAVHSVHVTLCGRTRPPWQRILQRATPASLLIAQRTFPRRRKLGGSLPSAHKPLTHHLLDSSPAGNFMPCCGPCRTRHLRPSAKSPLPPATRLFRHQLPAQSTIPKSSPSRNSEAGNPPWPIAPQTPYHTAQHCPNPQYPPSRFLFFPRQGTQSIILGCLVTANPCLHAEVRPARNSDS